MPIVKQTPRFRDPLFPDQKRGEVDPFKPGTMRHNEDLMAEFGNRSQPQVEPREMTRALDRLYPPPQGEPATHLPPPTQR